MKISIITACYNSVETLSGTLASVAAQDHQSVEYIVIDGGSTDGTRALVEREGHHVKVFLSEPDSGIYDALNKGITHATGEVVGLLHSDDLYAGSKVLARVATAFVDPEVVAVYGDLVYVAKDDTSRVVRAWRAGAFSSTRLCWGWMPPHPTLFLRRSLYELFGMFDTRYRIAADYDLMLRVLNSVPGKVVYLPEVLVWMRMGGVSNRSLHHLLQKSWEDYQILRRNRVGGLGALAWKNLSKVPQFVRARQSFS